MCQIRGLGGVHCQQVWEGRGKHKGRPVPAAQGTSARCNLAMNPGGYAPSYGAGGMRGTLKFSLSRPWVGFIARLQGLTATFPKFSHRLATVQYLQRLWLFSKKEAMNK